jgi:hypothetical protein
MYGIRFLLRREIMRQRSSNVQKEYRGKDDRNRRATNLIIAAMAAEVERLGVRIGVTDVRL